MADGNKDLAKKTEAALRAGRHLRKARKEAGLSLADLSSRTGEVLSGSRIGNWEQGTREIGIQEAEILAKHLKRPAAYLMGLVDEADCALLMLKPEQKDALLALVGKSAIKDDSPAAPDKASPVTNKKKPAEDRPKSAAHLPGQLQRPTGS